MTGQVISKITAGDGSTNLITNSFSGSGTFNGEEGKLKIFLFDPDITSLNLIEGMVLNVLMTNWTESYNVPGPSCQVEIYTANTDNKLNPDKQFLMYRNIVVTNGWTPMFETDVTRGFSIIYHDMNWHILEGIDLNDCSALSIINNNVVKSVSFNQGTLPSLSVTAIDNDYDKLIINTGTLPELTFSTATASYVTRD